MTERLPSFFNSQNQMRFFSVRSYSLVIKHGISPFVPPASTEDEQRILLSLLNSHALARQSPNDLLTEVQADLEAEVQEIVELYGELPPDALEPSPPGQLAKTAFKEGIQPILEARQSQNEGELRTALLQAERVETALRRDINSCRARLQKNPELTPFLDDIVPAYRGALEIATGEQIIQKEDEAAVFKGLMEKYRALEHGRSQQI